MALACIIWFSVSPVILPYHHQLDWLGFVDCLSIGQNNSYLLVGSVLMRLDCIFLMYRIIGNLAEDPWYTISGQLSVGISNKIGMYPVSKGLLQCPLKL
ncbi:uncharacterized protein J3R85_011062 [Psidium guajava]|nr:uncharacterized protein J3R85_011062 [Psidium guajava]